MRRVVLTVLSLSLLAVPASAQQAQYAGQEQEVLRTCFDNSIRRLSEDRVPLDDFGVVAIGLCNTSIKSYRDYILSFEQRRGNTLTTAQGRAESALATEFRRARDAFVAYSKKNSEHRSGEAPAEAEV
ncbi:hypothetical protein ACLBXM_00835 [Xanthobacteraceae bacterium A53D]